MEKFRIGWFSTGRDKAACDLLNVVQDSIRKGELKAEISFVFSNRGPTEAEETARFLALVGSYHLDLIYLSSREFQSKAGYKPHSPEWRLEYDREVMKRLVGLQSDLCVLAGYMLIVGPEMCQKYKMINLHPATPRGPTGSWQEVIWQLITEKADSSGVMMHLVTPELDKGPPVAYCTFPIKDEVNKVLWEGVEKGEGNSKQNLFNDIRFRLGLPREFPLIVFTLKAFSEGRVRIEGGKIVDASGKTLVGYNLTAEINAMVKEKLRKEKGK